MKNRVILSVSLTCAAALVPHTSVVADAAKAKPVSQLGAIRVGTPSASLPQKVSLAYVVYIPFEWQTYIAVTPESLRQGLRHALSIGIDKAQVTSTRKDIIGLSSQQEVCYLNGLLASRAKPSAFLKEDARVLVDEQDGGRQFFVDQRGTVSDGSREYTLTPDAFQKLKSFLHNKYGD